MMDFLSKERIVAPPGFNRWLVPPAALAIHLSIGMAYGFSVFWLPLSRAIGITKPVPCPADMSYLAQVFTPPVTGRSAACWGGCTPCSSCFWAARPHCGGSGSSESVRGKQVSWRPSAGVADC